jgi:glycyl-tRNA synthetase beta chain
VTDVVLEIGFENIPASYLPPVIEQIADDARAMLARTRLDYKNVRATATPRRLVLFVDGLAERQTASEELVRRSRAHSWRTANRRRPRKGSRAVTVWR